MSKIKINKRFELSDNSKTIPVNAKGIGNAVGTNAYIQVLDDRSLTALNMSATLDNSEDAMPVGVIDMADFTGLETIESAGVFLIPVTAFETLTFTADGSTEVIVKVVVE